MEGRVGRRISRLDHATELTGNPLHVPVLKGKHMVGWKVSGGERVGDVDAIVLTSDRELLIPLVQEFHDHQLKAMSTNADLRIKFEESSAMLWLAREDSRPLKVFIKRDFRFTPPGANEASGVVISSSLSTTVLFHYNVKDLQVPQHAITLLSNDTTP